MIYSCRKQLIFFSIFTSFIFLCCGPKDEPTPGKGVKSVAMSESPGKRRTPPEKLTMPKERKMVMMVVDTLRADRLGCYGYAKPTTPTIDRVAREGVLFETMHSASPWTAPSFGSIFTGVSPTVHGAGSLLAKGNRRGTEVLGATVGGLREDLPTLAELLPDDMVTGAFITNAFVSKELGMDKGFDHYDHRNASVYRSRRADEVTDRAIGWLEKNASKSFFLLLHYFDPHMSYDPPAQYVERFAPNKPRRISVPFTDHAAARDGSLKPNEQEKAFIRGLYDGEVRFVDDQMARVLQVMETHGLLDDTWIVVASDHGEEQFEHGSFDHGHAYEEEVTRVPFVIRAPGGTWRAGDRVSQSVRHVDIPPTILEILGEDAPGHFEGSSLLPVIEGRDTSDRPAYIEFNLFGGQQCALFDGRYKTVWDLRHKRGFYYDLKKDPKETTRLGKEDPKLAALLKNLMATRDALSKPAEGKKFREGKLSAEALEGLKSLGYIE